MAGLRGSSSALERDFSEVRDLLRCFLVVSLLMCFVRVFVGSS